MAPNRTFPSTRYRKLLDLIGMSQVGAARFLGIDARTSRRFASGETEVPPPIAMLLEVIARKGLDPSDVRKMAGLEPVEGIYRPAGRPPDDDD